MNAIVVGVDGTATSEGALEWAVREANARAAPLEIVHAWSAPVHDGWVTAAWDPEPFRGDAERTLADAIARARALGATNVTGRLVYGSASIELVAATEDAELVVVGARRHGPLARVVLGSVADAVVHHASGPVVVVPALRARVGADNTVH
jgi:nucleotide-binding universal stress UspA family protein